MRVALRTLSFVVVLAGAGAPLAAQPTAGSVAVPDAAAHLHFLQTAKVVSTRPIGKGITGALRVTLTDGSLTHDAAFQSIDQASTLAEIVKGKRRAGEVRFVDHYRYNLAAWRLAVRLGLGHMMPVTVERTIEGKRGALSWWVDDVLMDEAEREAKHVTPPSGLALARQRQRMDVFAELVRDTDRNKGNVIYTTSWQLVMLDFTRAFRLQKSLRAPDVLTMIDRTLLTAIRGLTREDLAAAVGDSLTRDEMDSVMARRALIVARFDELIAKRGESLVLY